jgi:hypothetical protein
MANPAATKMITSDQRLHMQKPSMTDYQSLTEWMKDIRLR